jgi:hypothetical protein
VGRLVVILGRSLHIRPLPDASAAEIFREGPGRQLDRVVTQRPFALRSSSTVPSSIRGYGRPHPWRNVESCLSIVGVLPGYSSGNGGKLPFRRLDIVTEFEPAVAPFCRLSDPAWWWLQIAHREALKKPLDAPRPLPAKRSLSEANRLEGVLAGAGRIVWS